MLDDEELDPASPMGAPLVLVVDDELAPRSAVCRMVRGLGYRAKSLETASQALRYLDTHPGAARLLLADVAMPAMDGAELAERARDLDPRLQIALLAGADREIGELLEGYRDLPTLTKPVGFGELYALLREKLGPPILAAGRPMPPTASARPRSSRRPSGRHEV
jgi:two-component system cell cycle sensor histidine kinase/response regulator CckA